MDYNKEVVNPWDVRKTILGMLYNSKMSHLGSSMSIVETLVSVFERLDIDAIKSINPLRSRFFLSKGHAASALYATMVHFDLMERSLLDTYCSDGSILSGHASHAIEGVEHSTGALGHGLPVASGCAIGLKSMKANDARVYALIGDGELQEGSIWESLLLAQHLKLNNLVTIVDNNSISSITVTKKIINMHPMKQRFEGLGFRVHDINGHNIAELRNALDTIESEQTPSVIIANTVKGYGVPFAENEAIWHYRSLNEELYNSAIKYIEER